MKTNITFILAAAIACLMVCVSCDKTETTGFKNRSEATELTIDLKAPTPGTKSTQIGEESGIHNVQIFVFRSDGQLDAYTSTSAKENIKLACSNGDRTVYALVNAPDASGIKTESEFKSTRSDLKDNSLAQFVMAGSKSITLKGSEQVEISVKRLVARLSIEKIVTDFAAPAYKNAEFKITGIYAINVAGDASVVGDGSPSAWMNQMKYVSSDCDALIYDKVDDAAVTSTSPYTSAHYFYVYPNPTSADASGSPFTPRYTRLVVETSLNGNTYYYPISIGTSGGIVSNNTYTIKTLTITKPGSTDPDIPVSSSDCSFSIVVAEWETGLNTDTTI